MSTSCIISAIQPDSTYKSIYCHWDGYPSHVGQILRDHYTDPDKINALIALGNLSSLYENLEPEGKHSFEKPEKGVAVAYHRDRGEPFKDLGISATLGLISCTQSYAYAWDGKEWINWINL